MAVTSLNLLSEIYLTFEDLILGKYNNWTRAVNRTVYGYGRTPYGKYTVPGHTVCWPYRRG